MDIKPNFTIISYNTRGINNSNKRRQIFCWLEELQADIVLLQEIHCINSFMPVFNCSWKGKVYHSLTSSKCHKGVAILFHKMFGYKLIDMHMDNEERRL